MLEIFLVLFAGLVAGGVVGYIIGFVNGQHAVWLLISRKVIKGDAVINVHGHTFSRNTMQAHIKGKGRNDA